MINARNGLVVVFLSAMLGVFGCKGAGEGPASSNAQSVGAGSVSAKIEKSGSLVVDVRSPDEYKSGHYPGAVNIPVGEVEARLSEFGERDRSIVLYCQSGGRSATAKRKLEGAGYTDVTNAGGLGDMPPPPAGR